MIRRTILALCIIPALVAGMLHVPAAAQAADQGGVGIQPLDTKPTDPNGGQWFFRQGAPGETLTFRARVVNLASVERTVKLYLADLNFSADGTPQIPQKQADSRDIGTWGGDVRTITLKPNAAEAITFTVTVPENADPGDHVGVVVIENPPEQEPGKAFAIVKRVSTRLYVTVPGDARPALKIESVKVEPDSSFFPREATVKVTLRNTGTIGLRPTVLINGEKAAGPESILTKSIENFVVTKKVPFWGGPQSYRVDVTSLVGLTTNQNRVGPVEQVRVSKFYFPYVLLIALAVLIGLFFLGRRWLRNRAGKYAAIRADMKRIERLLAEQRSGGDNDDAEDPELTIKAAIKRAGRAGDKDAEEKLKEKLAEHRAARTPVADVPPVAPVAPTPPPAPAPAPVTPAASAPSSDTYDWLKQDAPADHGPADAVPQQGYDFLKADDPPAPPEPPRVPVQAASGPGYFVPDPAPVAPPEPVVEAEPEPEPVAQTPAPAPVAPTPAPVAESRSSEPRDEQLAAILRELATAPKRKQEALIQSARGYGVLTLRAHGDLIEQLPADVRAKLVPKRAVI